MIVEVVIEIHENLAFVEIVKALAEILKTCDWELIRVSLLEAECK